MFSSTTIKTKARALGFNLVGLTPARPAPHLDAYFRWLDGGLHGTMGYLARPDRTSRRRALTEILAGARTLLLVGLDYRVQHLPPSLLADTTRGRIAMYAWGQDYHAVMLPRLEALAQELGGGQWRAYVDTGAILERDHAQQAGLGFIGKNTMLIHPRRGSDFFLGEILLDAEVDEYDTPTRETICGTCTSCLQACPTKAFVAPYVLDARKCISYLTIEHKGYIDHALRPLMGNWVYGCDVCQTVCPWNRFAIETQETAFFPLTPDRAAPLLTELLMLDDATFRARFANSAIERIGRNRLVRNACLAAGNSGRADYAPLLGRLLTDASPLVRAHAAWGVKQLQTDATILETTFATETDAEAKADMALLLKP